MFVFLLEASLTVSVLRSLLLYVHFRESVFFCLGTCRTCLCFLLKGKVLSVDSTFVVVSLAVLDFVYTCFYLLVWDFHDVLCSLLFGLYFQLFCAWELKIHSTWRGPQTCWKY